MTTNHVSKVEVVDPATDPRWDSFVERHPLGWLTHLSVWKRIIEESFDHMKGHYLAITAPDGEIMAGMPVFAVSSWLTGRRLVSIPCATLSDPLVTDRSEFEQLSAELFALSEKTGAKYVKIHSHRAADFIGSGLLQAHHSYKHHSLLLDRDPEQLKATFHHSCVRRRIGKALNSGVSLREGEGESDLQILYRLYTAMRKRVGLPPQPFRFFLKAWTILQPARLASLHIAEHGGRPVAALLLLKFKERVAVEVVVADSDYNDLSPSHLLYWEAIRSAWRDGYKVFDFGRTSPLNQSLMTFKGRWGTAVDELPVFYSLRRQSGSESNENGLKYKLFKSFCGIAPDPVFSLLGRFCYRHLG